MTTDVFDNSTGRNCLAPDALKVDKLVQGIVATVERELIGIVKDIKQLLQERGVTYQGYACESPSYVASSNKKRVARIKSFNKDKRNPAKYMALMIMPSKEDIKREAFYRASTCDCAKGVLGKQQDFASQKNGLEEVYEKFNVAHNTQNNLNSIECAWGLIQYHVRRHTDGTLSKLKQLGTGEFAALSDTKVLQITKTLSCCLRAENGSRHGREVDQAETISPFASSLDILNRIYFPQQTTNLITAMEDRLTTNKRTTQKILC